MITKHFFDNIDNSVLAKECYDFVERFPEKHFYISNRNNGIQVHKTEGYIETGQQLHLLKKQALKLVPEAVDIQLWININFPGSYNSFHNHLSEGCIGSAAYYVKVSEDSGDFVYKDIEDNIRYITPKEGMIINFSKELMHGVEPNVSEEDRISIAFNYTNKEFEHYY
jgi:hypothetical protein